MKRRFVIASLSVAVLFMVAGCNRPPNIPKILASATQVESGDIVTLSALATDPDEDELDYRWRATGGVFDDSISVKVNWTAPEVTEEEIFTITLVVEDPEGETNSEVVDITVFPDTTPDVEGHVVYLGFKQGSLEVPFIAGGYGRTQFLYFADEIDTSGKIIKIGFMPSDTTLQGFENIKIWLYEVSVDSIVDTLEDNIGEAKKYLVYQGSSIEYGIKDEWFDFNFSTPFDYDGTSNLLIVFEFDIFVGEVEEPVRSWAYDLSGSVNRHVNVVRAADEFGDAARGVPYLKLVFEKEE
ncbi:hypothetical protein JXM67_14765 [candidate division WOR-3 bacterium]|nr:hypothetical protein [candidate division WOR-3 bacterium]